MAKNALIVGAGSGLSASFARALARDGLRVALAARRTDKLGDLAGEIGAETFACDAADPDSVASLFADVDARVGPLDLVLYNPSARVRGPLVDLDPEAVRKAILISGYGGFLVAQ